MLQANIATIILRAISVGLEHANAKKTFPQSVFIKEVSFASVKEVLAYTLYPPTFFVGPIVLFSDWCAWRKSQLRVRGPNLITTCAL